MYEIRVKTEFSAAHNLRGYKGRCEKLHGHNWQVEVVISSGVLNEIGMVVDFKKVKGLLARVLKDFDHSYLNKLEPFNRENPTSENLARFIYDKLKKEFKGKVLAVKEITVWESANCSATYYI